MGRSSASAGNRRPLRKLLSNTEVINRDPWDLPSVFFVTRDHGWWFGLKTVSGYWDYKDDEFIGIRSGASSSSTTSNSMIDNQLGIGRYTGVRRTLEFYRDDDVKTDWVIHEYNHIDIFRNKRGEPSLFLQDEVVICKVFKKGATHETSSSPLSGTTILNIKGESSDADDVRATHMCKELQDEVDSLLESRKEDAKVDCDTDAKSDNDVWQHFTKIGTKNPGVVYAVCHHCDKALKAHCSKKHCISQLERHMNSDKCRSSCSNPSTDEDREMLHRLRAVHDDLYKQQKMDGKPEYRQEVNANLTQLNPWVLGHNPWYVTTSLNRQTNEGCWEEIDKEFTAIRMEEQQMQGFWMEILKDVTTVIQNDYQFQMKVPQYMGLRRTLEFHHNQNGNKLMTGWIMHEYQLVDNIESPALLLQGDMVIRKVFRYDKHAVASAFSDLNRQLNGDDDSEEYSYKGDRKRKRNAASKRTSKVWMYFTEIRTADNDVVYAVCHHCDRGYSSGRSTNGTSHLWRHNKSCTGKAPGTENANNGGNAAWEAEIWPMFLLFKNYKVTEHQASGLC